MGVVVGVVVGVRLVAGLVVVVLRRLVLVFQFLVLMRRRIFL
ncbi:hypothetical protein QWM81_10080 [Streptomyces ficellus]|uniref:Uncharacterized protein n=1 Tax=Streptomyces ficellus TaxID=1977088 RepID=A0ABT7Z4J2_9ACTN|nr:hypothetical protein [Streptomyces ficellus]MDN3294392.1 hypothetical protein [Streptomyces ficellus]